MLLDAKPLSALNKPMVLLLRMENVSSKNSLQLLALAVRP